MSSLQRIAFIGNHLPRRCGIATFTRDLHQAISLDRDGMETGVVTMTDANQVYDYPPAVCLEIHDQAIGEYIKAAEFLNKGRFDVVSLQHEYGIFGGEAGGHIVELLSRLEMPVVTTLHTVLANPTPAQYDVMNRIIDASAKMVVMANKGSQLLRLVHGVPAHNIEIIPHGIPEFPFIETHLAKAKLNFAGKIILTFGLLSPSKGIETVIDAMPEIVKVCPDAVYVVLGATHPNLLREQGEAYRESLIARVQALEIEDHVVFCNQFVDQAVLLDFLSMCDVYVTPYLNEAQMTSGTLAYSFGLGKAVVSTPYWHAKELLDDGLGVLVPFSDARAIGSEISRLLTDDPRRDAMRKRAYASSRSMTWAQTAKRYIAVFERAREQIVPEIAPPLSAVDVSPDPAAILEVKIDHFLSLCDSTGILQHSVYSVADRAHGYCVDDNARALLFSCALAGFGEGRLQAKIDTASYAAFIQHAWNPDTRRFRNFMSYERRWLEPVGSEDSHGRTLWALGECALTDTDASRRAWAGSLFKIALPAVLAFTSPRAWAFALLGLNAYCTVDVADVFAARARRQLADRLMALFRANQSVNWLWFEGVLAYDNARLSQALIETGMATHTPPYVDVGLRSLRWLISLQTAPSSCFRPIGSNSFGKVRSVPDAFDQQPIEASATISACLAAWRMNKGDDWVLEARRAFDWFFGKNDLQAALVDVETGSCLDGLHPDRPNENKGAESVLSYLLGLVAMQQLLIADAVGLSKSESRTRTSNGNGHVSRLSPGSPFVPIQIFESAESLPASRSGTGRREALQAGDRASRLEPN